MADSLALPRGIKIFCFAIPDEPLDKDVEKTIQFLAEKRGWKESHLCSYDVQIEQHGLMMLTLQYLIPLED